MADALKIALILTAVDKASAIFDKAGKKMKASMAGMDKSKSFFNKYGNYATVAGAAATAAFIPAIHAAEENEVAVRKLEQVYRSMGQNVENASKQSQAYASRLEYEIAVEDEAIMAVQSKLAVFKKVSDETARMNGVMNRATAAAYDLGANGFGDASSNAIKLGKLLENPTKNLNALSRAGIQFTGVEKKKIEALQKSGKLQQAQDLILKSVEKRVGGVAKATTTATAKARVAWSEVTESLGKALLPTFTKIVEKINEIIPKIQAWIEKNGTLIKWIAAISAAVLGLGVAMKVIAFGIGTIQTVITAISTASKFLLANPIVLIIAAIAAAAYLIYDNWGAISAWFTKLWGKVKDVFNAVWRWIKKIFWDNSPAVLIYNNWNKIVSFFQALWAKVKEHFSMFIDFVTSLPGRFWQAGVDMVNSLWEGIKSIWHKLTGWFEKAWNFIKKPIEILFGKSQAANDRKTEAVFKASNNFYSNNMPSMAGGGTPVYNSTAKNNTQLKYAPIINLSGTATPADAAMINTATQRGFDKMMRKHMNNKERTGFQ